MNDGQNAKQQIVERIKSANNILVTVNKNPSVDELAAALGLTIMLNGLNKHATAVVSGDIPPAINFLEPTKTFENTVDSLRDFIIALDKEKADHLRYKVDGDVVKIFITPYRTTITSDDLDFSQGDYNVEVVLALGVQDKDHLDAALSAHGRILHDATVATLSCGDTTSDLGSIDWSEPNSSSLSEMLVALSEALKGDKPLLDEQSATAFLTGIVAATDRFSNNRTSSKVMTMAAQLMAAGANQQLIAAKLEEAHEIGPDKDGPDSNNSDGTTNLSEGKSTKLDKKASDKPKKTEEKKDDGSLAISHEKEGDIDQVAKEAAADVQSAAADKAEDDLAKQLETVAPTAAKPSVADLQKDIAAAGDDVTKAADEAVLPPVSQAKSDKDADEPSMGGTLNATTEQAQKDAEQALHEERNKTILSHGNGEYVGDSAPTFQAPFNASGDKNEEPNSVDIFKDTKPAVDLDRSSDKTASVPESPPSDTGETLADLDKKNRDAHANAQAAVNAAFDSASFDPANQPTAANGAQQLGDVPHESIPPLSFEQTSPASPPQQPQQPVPAQQSQAPQPPALPDFSVLPPPPKPPAPPMPPSFDQPQGPLPPDQLGQIFNTSPEPVAPPAAKDPNQFNIPGQ